MSLVAGLSLFVVLTAGQDVPQASQVDRLVACRQVAAPDERLACFDRAVVDLEEARRTGQVAVVDRAQIEQTRREAFGFSLPNLSRVLVGANAPEIEEVETTLVSATRSEGGPWTFRLADGSTWRQINTDSVMIRNREGQAVRVRRGAVGSFLLTVGSSRAIRVRRQ